jgi:hypothetical protein
MARQLQEGSCTPQTPTMARAPPCATIMPKRKVKRRSVRLSAKPKRQWGRRSLQMRKCKQKEKGEQRENKLK